MSVLDCDICGAKVNKVSRALCQKLIDRDTKRFFCLACLAEYLDVSEDDLLALAEEFKNGGCELFS